MKKLTITAREVRLLREEASAIVESNHVPGQRKDRQPWEWHEGQELMALAKKLEAYRRANR